MKLNGMTKILDDGGDYVVLIDYSSEGIYVMGQFKTLPEAMRAALGDCSERKAIVKLIDVPSCDRGELQSD